MSTPFIPDGYTRCGSLAGSEIHPPLRFEYRPMLSRDRARFLERIRRLAPEGDVGMAAAEQITIQELSRRLVSWTLVDQSGAPLSIAEENLMHIDPHLLASLTCVVLGLSSDEAQREADDEKNCGAGCGCCSPLPALPPATAAIVKCTCTTKRRAAGNGTPADRSCDRPARSPRVDWRTSVVPKEPLKNCTPSLPKTNKRTGSTASAARWECSPMIPLSGGTRS